MNSCQEKKKHIHICNIFYSILKGSLLHWNVKHGAICQRTPSLCHLNSASITILQAPRSWLNTINSWQLLQGRNLETQVGESAFKSPLGLYQNVFRGSTHLRGSMWLTGLLLRWWTQLAVIGNLSAPHRAPCGQTVFMLSGGYPQSTKSMTQYRDPLWLYMWLFSEITACGFVLTQERKNVREHVNTWL